MNNDLLRFFPKFVSKICNLSTMYGKMPPVALGDTIVINSVFFMLMV